MKTLKSTIILVIIISLMAVILPFKNGLDNELISLRINHLKIENPYDYTDVNISAVERHLCFILPIETESQLDFGRNRNSSHTATISNQNDTQSFGYRSKINKNFIFIPQIFAQRCIYRLSSENDDEDLCPLV